MPQAPAFHFNGVVDRASIQAPPDPRALPAASAQEGSDPFIEILDAAVSDFGGNGAIALWRPAAGDIRVLHMTETCNGESRLFNDLMTAARAGDGEARDQRASWRSLEKANDPAAIQVAFPVTNGTVYLGISSISAVHFTRLSTGGKAARIFSFMHPFFRSWSERLMLKTSLEGHCAAMNGSDVGIVLVDRDGLILSANVAADHLLEVGDGVRRKGKMVHGCTLADTMKLSAAIDHVVTPSTKLVARSPRAVLRFDRMAGHPLLMTIIAADLSLDTEGAAAAIIYIVDPDRDIRAMVGPVCKLYGMSPVETSLACELAMGRSISEAAREIRVREATARSYLKQLFSKTDTHRQAELVRLLIGGAVGVNVTVTGCATTPI